MNRTKLTIVSFIILFTASLFVLIGCSTQEEEVVKIGADFTLTGNLAYWSTELQKGMDFAKNEIDTLNKIQIVYEDNAGKANEAVNIFKKLVTVDKVNAVVTCFTPIGQPLRDIASEFKVPLIATVTSAKDFAVENEWTFRDFPTQEQQSTALANYVFQSMKLRKGSFLVVNDDYGKDGAEIFQSVFERLGGVFYEGDYFSQTDKSMRNQISKVLSKNPEFMLIIGRDQALALVCRQIREVDDNIKIIGVNAFDASIVWDLLGEIGEGIVFTSAYVDYENNIDAKNFKNNYKKQFNEDPNYVVVYGYSMAKYLIDILYRTGKDNDKIRMELQNLNVNSIRGELITNSKRDITSPIGIYKRTNNRTSLLSKATK